MPRETFPADRWRRAGATAEELVVLERLNEPVTHLSHADLSDRLEAHRESGVFTEKPDDPDADAGDDTDGDEPKAVTGSGWSAPST